MHWEYKRIHTGPTLQCQGSRGKRTKSLAANLIPVSVSKNFARSVNVTRPHSVKDPTRSSCNTTPVLSCDRANRPKPGIGHAFGPWREWFLSLHTNQGHAPATCGNKHSPGRTCHVSGDCTHSPCSNLALAPVHLACQRLSVRLFVLQEICVTELFWQSVIWSISDFVFEPSLVQSFGVSNDADCKSANSTMSASKDCSFSATILSKSI